MEIQNVIADSSLLRSASSETARLAAREGRLRTASRGAVIAPEGLVLIVRGAVQVSGSGKGGTLVLNTLRCGDFFGAASLFGGACPQTVLTALEDCTLLELPQEAVERLMQADFEFTRSYIRFLTGKICFLNQKIAAFTAGSAEKKLARYLLSLPEKDGGVELPLSMLRLAGALDIGRASLYRAFDFLEENGLAVRQGSRVLLTARENLQKLYGGTL